MTAGLGHAALVATGRARREHARGEAGATALHRRRCLVLAGQQAVLVALQESRLEELDDFGQGVQSTVPQLTAKRLIKPSMRTLHCSAVWLVRWCSRW